MAAADNFIRDEELKKLEEVIDIEWLISEDFLTDFNTSAKASIICDLAVSWLFFIGEYYSFLSVLRFRIT